jgi:hypothetical protein
MIREIYCRLPGDAGYIPHKIEIDNSIEYILQKVRVCLGTRPGEVLGNPTFGINLSDYVFDMSVDKKEIEERIDQLLQNYVQPGSEHEYLITSRVAYGHNTTDTSDYLLVDIYIDDVKYLGIVVT